MAFRIRPRWAQAGLLFAGIAICGLLTGAAAPAPFDLTHKAWDDLAIAHVRGGRVDYAGLKRDKAKLQAYVDSVAKADARFIGASSPGDRAAFYANAYNANLALRIANQWPVKSILEAFGADSGGAALEKAIVTAAGNKHSLLDLEAKVIPQQLSDARVQFLLARGSSGSPPMPNRALTAENLEQYMALHAEIFMRDPQSNRLNRVTKTLNVSSLLRWRENLFAPEFKNPRGVFFSFATPADQEFLNKNNVEVKFLDYDWSINNAD